MGLSRGAVRLAQKWHSVVFLGVVILQISSLSISGMVCCSKTLLTSICKELDFKRARSWEDLANPVIQADCMKPEWAFYVQCLFEPVKTMKNGFI